MEEVSDMTTDGDRTRTILALVVARATKDGAFRKKLIMNPAEVLKQEGLDMPGVTFKVLENTSSVQYLALGRNFAISEANIAGLVETLKNVLPIPEAHEVRLVQSTEATRYMVLPYVAGDAFTDKLTDAELVAMAGGSWSCEATKSATTEAVAAETTEVTVTQTTEVQDVETTTTAAAEAEVVAVAAAVLT